jgi:hypothetical protein
MASPAYIDKVHHTCRTRAKDRSSIIVISEPKAGNKSASIIAQQVGLKTIELNAEAKSKWQVILSRSLENH